MSIVALRHSDIIVTSPEGFKLNGITPDADIDYTTDGTNTSDYVW